MAGLRAVAQFQLRGIPYCLNRSLFLFLFAPTSPFSLADCGQFVEMVVKIAAREMLDRVIVDESFESESTEYHRNHGRPLYLSVLHAVKVNITIILRWVYIALLHKILYELVVAVSDCKESFVIGEGYLVVRLAHHETPF